MPSVITLEGARHLGHLAESPVVEWLRRQNPIVMAATVLGASVVTGLVVSSVFARLYGVASNAMKR